MEKQASITTNTKIEKMKQILAETISTDRREIARLKQELRRETLTVTTAAKRKTHANVEDLDQGRKVQKILRPLQCLVNILVARASMKRIVPENPRTT